MNATMSVDKSSIVDEIQRVLDGNGNISAATKDRLILMAMKQLFVAIEGEGGLSDRVKYLEKYKPYLQAIAWAVGIIAGALMLAIVTGQLQFVWVK
jgi:hypothetical protein